MAAQQVLNFALAPALVGADVIDYSTSAGAKLYRAACEPLPHVVDCSPAGLKVFLADIRDRAITTGWENILNIPTDPVDPTILTDLCESYGLITLQNVRAHATTYVNLQTRAAQNSMQLYQCIMASLTKEGKAKVMLNSADYAIGIHYSGACLLKVVIGLSNTNATTTVIKGRLSSLAAYIKSISKTMFALIVIGFAAKQFRGEKVIDELSFGSSSSNSVVSPLSQLFDDLYGDQDQYPFKRNSRGMFNPFRPDNNGRGGGHLPKNTGVPVKQYLQVTYVNQKYDSYRYSLVAATQSKAVAAAQYRQWAFDRAWGRALALLPSVHQQLQQLEQTFLKEMSTKQQAVLNLQTSLAQTALDEEMEKMGMKSVYQLDPPEVVVDNNNKTSVGGAAVVKGSSSSRMQDRRSMQLSQVSKLQTELTLLETEFLKKVVTTVGPTHAASVRTALLSSGSGSSFWSDRAQRPLSSLLSAANGSEQSSLSSRGKKVFLIRFRGDATASQVSNLREEVTAIVASATSGADEVIVVLQTRGGTVTGYGLAAAQLLRFKQAGVRLTVAVEQVATSGGYMMACIADKIVASPFAVLGSIGVISDIPNVYERLKHEGIEFQTVTAGKYKRTLTPTKKVTKEDIIKTQSVVEDILVLFRDFVAESRPQLDIDKVATGETWFGTAALERKLCDEIKTVDDVLLQYIDSGYDVFEVAYKPPLAESPLFNLLPVGAEAATTEGPVRTMLRWLMQAVASAVQSELNSMDVMNVITNKPMQEQVMAIDGTADRVRIQD